MEKPQPGSSNQEKPPRSAQKKRPRNAAAAPESDRDSGYSDVVSECLSSVEQTDPEDCPPSSHEKPPWCAPAPPLLVLKDLLVDQGSGAAPHVQSRAVCPPYQLLPSTPQILLFPPSVPPRPLCIKPTNYLPILNSYTRIAPHPSRHSSRITNKRVSDLSQHSQAKCKGSAAPKTNVQRGAVLSDESSCCEPGLITPEDTGEPINEGLPIQQNRNRRFHNTLDILHSSGLLSIAMKTKELARVNQATQWQLERLQEHVALFTKAVCSNNPQDWQTVQDALVRSHITLKEIDM